MLYVPGLEVWGGIQFSVRIDRHWNPPAPSTPQTSQTQVADFEEEEAVLLEQKEREEAEAAQVRSLPFSEARPLPSPTNLPIPGGPGSKRR